MLKIGLIALGFTLFSCASQQIAQQQFPMVDGRYDSEFPVQNISDELAHLSTTVRKLDCLVFYLTYVFPLNNPLEKNNLSDIKINKYASGSDVTNESVSGTATIVYYDGNQLGLLTCAHVVEFPDSLFNYYPDGSLQSLSVKLKQQNFVAGLPDGEALEIVATDTKKDIALLKKKLFTHVKKPAVLKYPRGKTKDLEWGTIVYTMGYPLGNLMVTNAIVSNPGKAENGKFLTDALFNHGISGSPVMALRDGVPNFEWVGMACSASAKSIYYLKPGKNIPQFVAPNSAYSGEVFIDHEKIINYGVTYSVSIEEILRFLSVNNKLLIEEGFDTDLFFE